MWTAWIMDAERSTVETVVLLPMSVLLPVLYMSELVYSPGELSEDGKVLASADPPVHSIYNGNLV